MERETSFSAASLRDFTRPYKTLLKDRRLHQGFDACVWGIFSSGSCKVTQIAASNPLTAAVKHSERRLRRLVHGGNKRAEVSAEALGKVLTLEGAKRLAGEHEVLLILDESDLRKPYASELEYLDTVRDLEGEPVAGFHTLTVLGIGASGVRALLYRTSFSTHAPGFVSVNDEYRKAIKQVSGALRAQHVGMLLWVMDRGFDDSKLLSWIHAQGECFVVRTQHPERKAKVRVDGQTKPLQSWFARTSPLGRLPLAKRLFSETPGKATYQVDVRVVKVELEQLSGSATTAVQLSHPNIPKPWLLLSNLRLSDNPVEQLALGTRIVQAYRQRWAIEDLFSWTKSALNWESVRVLDYEALRTLVAFAWLAAAFLFELGTSHELPEVLVLAHLGGWTPGKNKPGQAVLCKGLARLSHHLVLQQLSKNPRTASSLHTLPRDLLRP